MSLASIGTVRFTAHPDLETPPNVKLGALTSPGHRPSEAHGRMDFVRFVMQLSPSWPLVSCCCILCLMDMPARLGKFNIYRAASAEQLDSVRTLFREYAASLEISLCFQNFEQELASLPGSYAPPSGMVLLAQAGSQVAGCVAVRPLGQGVCEMKRLFVRPAWRGEGLGRSLVEVIIAASREIGYDCMRLDTLASMKPAISLYRSLGFRQIPAYYANPSEGAVFMELPLGRAGKFTEQVAREKGR